ncbi:MAG: MSHA biogenesis protein MshK [Betaproteobacteria bacterium]|nr:MSHA biogenesis protein MshK [Betaproteobacteria bacterium]
MNDPMRPPATLYSNVPGDANAPVGPVLQSVKISPTERSAVIGGERVTVGGKYGDARVVRITDNEVVLRSAGGTETLKMYPGVEINPVKPPAPAVEKQPRKSKSKKTTPRKLG